jgi:thiol-disulfide isomerase/thioredoxin
VITRILSTVILTLGLGASAFGQSSMPDCEASRETEKVFDFLRAPQDTRHSANETRDNQLSLLRSALQTSSNDFFLLKMYQDVEIGPHSFGRSEAIKKYEALLRQHPDDPIYLYLAARAQFSHNTKQAIDYLQQSIAKAPQFAWPRLLLAEIYQSESFSNPAQSRANLEAFEKMCPSNLDSFSSLRLSYDKELIMQTIGHLRQALGNRIDSEAVNAYSAIWHFEAAETDTRPDAGTALREQVKRDLDRLRQKDVPRNAEWYRVLQAGADIINDHSIVRSAMEEMADLYPNSDFIARLDMARWEDSHPPPPSDAPDDAKTTYSKARLEKARELSRRYPGMFYTALISWDAVSRYAQAPVDDMSTGLTGIMAALTKYPEGLRSLPPYQMYIAETLLKRGVRIQDVPGIVAKGLEETDRRFSDESASDLFPDASQDLARARSNYYLTGYFLQADAYMRLNQLTKAKDVLFKADEQLANIRPDEKATSMQKVFFGETEARYWQAKGQLAEKEGRKLDALVLYRNALVAFPPRGPRGDSRDEIKLSTQRIWKEMGGSEQGWNEWAAHSSLERFNAGILGANAWQHLAQTKPQLVLTDWQGKQWKPSELKDKTTFVSYWATWCLPCRAELPYLQKLYERFKDRQDVVIISLNVDDDPAAMVPFLKNMGFSMPSIAARDFGYELLPVTGVPSNWIVSAKGNEMFLMEGTGEQWLAAATAALEKASKK